MAMEGNNNLGITLLDAQYKDDSPIKTVERIKRILHTYSIETEEKWNVSGVMHCYSNQVTIKGTSISANGKGLTKEFALASAYGELMERIQLGMVGSNVVQKSGYYNEAIDNDVEISVDLLLRRNLPWYEAISSKLYQYTGSKVSAKEILLQFADPAGKISTIPCYNLISGKQEYFPLKMRDVAYGSNGAAAGNTLEEAIVQAIGEIVERQHQQRILTEDIIVPDIPEHVLKHFDTAYSIITHLRQNGLRVHVKDCSLSTRFPVVCVCYIDEGSGRYRTHFGANPVLEIAIERALTESFQGRNVMHVAQYEDFLYNKSHDCTAPISYEEITMGAAEKKPEFFVGQATYGWNDSVGFAGKNNKELLGELVNFFGSQGYDVLVHDASCMGFPTYQVIIPGYSEVMLGNLVQKQSMFSYLPHSVKTLRNPSVASKGDYVGFLMHIGKMREFSERDVRMLSFSMCSKLSLGLSNDEDSFLLASSLAYVHYSLGNFTLALTFIEKMIPLAQHADVEYLICLKRLLSLMLNKHCDEKIQTTLRYFHRAATVDTLLTCVSEKNNPFEKFTLHCNQANCKTCLLRMKCGEKQTQALVKLLGEKSRELNFEEFATRLSKYRLINSSSK